MYSRCLKLTLKNLAEIPKSFKIEQFFSYTENVTQIEASPVVIDTLRKSRTEKGKKIILVIPKDN